MKTLIPCELRDLDGSYALVRPIDDVRCRVIDSNVFQKGEQLRLKSVPYDWREGSQDIGGCTRASLEDLLPPEDSLSNESVEDPLQDCARHHESARGRHDDDLDEHLNNLGSLDPGDDSEDVDDFDFDAALRRLTFHFVEVHLHLADGVPTMEECRCPGIAPANEWARDRLYAMIWITFALGKFLSIPQMIMAMGEIGMTPRLMD